ncbi:hypothetical protein, partial [Klebsiella aerogenes]|uniref:hypothetical protein n=2 Tax=Klebsiella aerogenes TaxID=548 RepID=UPI003A80EB55
KQKAQSKDWAFCFCVLWPDTMASPGGAALTGAADRSPACAACGKISLHHLITFIQSHIKPRRCNHFAIIHFFTAHVLTLIAKTGVTKKNVNTITYK